MFEIIIIFLLIFTILSSTRDYIVAFDSKEQQLMEVMGNWNFPEGTPRWKKAFMMLGTHYIIGRIILITIFSIILWLI